MFSFQTIHSLDKRIAESTRIKTKFLDHLPIIIEPSKEVNKDHVVDKNKYLVPKNLSFGQLKCVVRKRAHLHPEEAIFLYINGSILPTTSELIENLYEKYKNEDGFLYIQYAMENVFG